MRIIDADELHEMIRKSSEDAGFYRPIYAGFLNCIDQSPTIDPESLVKQGQWKMEICADDGIRVYSCPNCGFALPLNPTKIPRFCEDCGTKLARD